MSTPDLFDAYFQRADTNRDGRISGQEAVSFFQGANLHREVLAKIWQYADQGQIGYLSRAEFYNALKLVTVAQTGRDLTPAIVSRALNGPAASQIPAPQIQFAQGPAPVSPLAHIQGGGRPIRSMGSSTPPYQQYPAGNSSSVPQPTRPAVLNKQGNLSVPARPASTPTDWPTNKSSSWPGPASSNNLNGAQDPSLTTQGGLPGPAFSGANSAPVKSDLEVFGLLVSSQAPRSSASPQTPQPTGTAGISQPRGMQAIDRLSFSLIPSSATSASSPKVLQPVSTSVDLRPSPYIEHTKVWPKITDANMRGYTKIFFEVDTDKDGKISGTQAHDLFLSWHLPREVLKQIWDLSDQDHDSMLSLREFCVSLYLMERHREGRVLPAAINAASYFDESGIQALRISEAQVAVAQNSAGFNLPAWRQNPGVLQASGPGLPPRPISHGILGQSPVRPLMPATGRGGPTSVQLAQANSKFSVADMKLGPQSASSSPSIVQSKHQEGAGSERKVQEFEKQIMDSKEKMEFYRTKLQDAVLFKTRCDNRLAEITDKAAADKREVDSLAKRYDEKYKQAGESQSRLLADEAAFRDIEERRLELHNALVRMEQGGDLNAFLQARADRLQNDLDELKRVLDTKCKLSGLRVKPISVLEIPFGWQPGIQESAAHWDEEWDKFEEEGFGCVQEFTEEGSAGSDASKPKTLTSWDEKWQQEDEFEPSSTNSDVHVEETPFSDNNHTTAFSQDRQDSKAENGDQEVSASDLRKYGSGISSMEDTWDPHKLDHKSSSPKSEFGDSLFNGGEQASTFNHPKEGTESNASWGGIDILHTKTSDYIDIQAGKASSGTMFASDDPFDKLSISRHEKDDLPTFGPIRTKEWPSVFFDASVPSTPLHSNYSTGPTSGGSFFDASVPSTPLRSGHLPGPMLGGSFFDASVPSTPLHSSYSHDTMTGGSFFDDSVPSTPAYSNNASAFGSTREALARFDSFNSVSSDFPYSSDGFTKSDSFNHANNKPSSRGFVSFDESGPLSNGPFGGQHGNHSTDAWSAFG